MVRFCGLLFSAEVCFTMLNGVLELSSQLYIINVIYHNYFMSLVIIIMAYELHNLQ